MDKIKQLFANNYSYARMKEENSTYFKELRSPNTSYFGLAALIAVFRLKNSQILNQVSYLYIVMWPIKLFIQILTVFRLCNMPLMY